MNRRKAMKLAAGVVVGGGAGLYAFTNAFKPKIEFDNESHPLDFTPSEGSWNYALLDPVITAGLAYQYYSEGSCMYATIKSIVSQLAEKVGGPFASFPYHMFKYGHGGVGGYGTVCGTLNGAAALIGLMIDDKSVRDNMIADIFKWYEKEPLPGYSPQKANYNYVPEKSTAHSVLCHASNTNWCKASGFKVNSKERKERCSRLSGDVAQKVTTILNQILTDTYIAGKVSNEEASTCISCHGSEGKVNNTAVKMNCTSCHTKSIGHRVFADVHYKMME